MPRSRYPDDPDGTTDVDRRAGPEPNTRQATVQDEATVQERALDRAGHRDLDATIEAARGMTRAGRDHARATPRERTAPLGDKRMARSLPAGGTRRVLMSTRQRSARSKTKHQVQDQLSGTQHRELSRLLMDDPNRWDAVNDQLSDAAGDVQQLPDDEIRSVQRIDRAIQAYETHNTRSHVVYTNVQAPGHVNASDLDRFARSQFPRGSEITFDRYTLGAHNMHETEVADRHNHRVIVFEIATRRGMYLGQSGSGHDTSHLLPRGMRLWVQTSTRATYQRPDGTTGRRTVVQLTDTPPAGATP